VTVSEVKQSNSVTHIHTCTYTHIHKKTCTCVDVCVCVYIYVYFFIFFFIIDYYKVLNIVPCTIQEDLLFTNFICCSVCLLIPSS